MLRNSAGEGEENWSEQAKTRFGRNAMLSLQVVPKKGKKQGKKQVQAARLTSNMCNMQREQKHRQSEPSIIWNQGSKVHRIVITEVRMYIRATVRKM